MLDLDWINTFLEELPQAEVRSKNIFDISGYPNWENVNSNFLAFYLNDTEEHQMKRLFIDSILDCIEEQTSDSEFDRSVFESSFQVFREYSTAKGRIDLLIISDFDKEDNSDQPKENLLPDWAIIIENKIHHHLHGNDLNDYWQSIKALGKVGIVLSPWEVDSNLLQLNDKHRFINITHQKYVEKIKSNLPLYFEEADSRHLLFLKEYFLNINSLYQSPMQKNQLAQQLTAFHKHRKNVEEVIKMNEQLLTYLNEEVSEAFNQMNYYSETTNTSRSKHFYFDWEDKNMPSGAGDFRFWVDLNRLRYHSKFECIFELYGHKKVSKGPQLLQTIKTQISASDCIQLANDNQSFKHQHHLFYIHFPLDGFEEIGLSSKIESKLKAILKWDQEGDYLSICYKAWHKLINP